MLSVFTPSHNPTYLGECLNSLLEQTYDDWEWIVLLVDGARWNPQSNDARVKVFILDQLRGVGAAKSYACQLANGEILVELDHDDLLTPNALERVADTFAENPGASLVYSDFAQVLADGSPDPVPPFGSAYGWTFEALDDGRCVVKALDCSYPHNASYIWYQPNHVRAFRKDVYFKVGGYDWHRDVLDDQDLMNRLYRAGDFVHIPECLYMQRMHDANTQRQTKTNARIQTETVEQYDENVQANALAWADRNALLALDLGSAHNKPAGYLGVDQYPGPGVDFAGDIFNVLDAMPSDSVGVIRAVDFLEHISDRVRLFNEMHRVLAHGGMLLSLTPSTDGRGAWQDPTHVSGYNDNAFWYFTQAEHARYVPEITARFHVSKIVTSFPTEWHEQHRIAYVQANLVALKSGGARMGGLSGWE